MSTHFDFVRSFATFQIERQIGVFAKARPGIAPVENYRFKNQPDIELNEYALNIDGCLLYTSRCV